jgi:hypothetical protein
MRALTSYASLQAASSQIFLFFCTDKSVLLETILGSGFYLFPLAPDP